MSKVVWQAGLLRHKPGPHGAHKLTAQALDFVAEARAADRQLRSVQLAGSVRQRFGLQVHPRSIDRQLARKKSALTCPSGATQSAPRNEGLIARYEDPRCRVLERRGMQAWMFGRLAREYLADGQRQARK